MKLLVVLLSLLILSGCSMIRGKINADLQSVLTSEIPLECSIGYIQGLHVGESMDLKLQAQLLALNSLGINKELKEYKDCFAYGVRSNILGTKAHNLIMRCVNGICALGAK